MVVWLFVSIKHEFVEQTHSYGQIDRDMSRQHLLRYAYALHTRRVVKK